MATQGGVAASSGGSWKRVKPYDVGPSELTLRNPRKAGGRVPLLVGEILRRTLQIARVFCRVVRRSASRVRQFFAFHLSRRGRFNRAAVWQSLEHPKTRQIFGDRANVADT